MRRVLLVAAVLALSVPALAATLANVTMPDTVVVGSRTLVLNGMGIRTKRFGREYVAGLYLEKKTSEAAAVIQSETARRLLFQFVTVEATREDLAKAFEEGLTANAPAEVPSIAVDITKFVKALETMHDKEQMAITYLPGTGTTLTIRGKDKLTIRGEAFAEAVFATWLGASPQSVELRDGLLGKGGR